jgi:hypothetical protein
MGTLRGRDLHVIIFRGLGRTLEDGLQGMVVLFGSRLLRSGLVDVDRMALSSLDETINV